MSNRIKKAIVALIIIVLLSVGAVTLYVKAYHFLVQDIELSINNNDFEDAEKKIRIGKAIIIHDHEFYSLEACMLLVQRDFESLHELYIEQRKSSYVNEIQLSWCKTQNRYAHKELLEFYDRYEDVQSKYGYWNILITAMKRNNKRNSYCADVYMDIAHRIDKIPNTLSDYFPRDKIGKPENTDRLIALDVKELLNKCSHEK